MVLFGLLRLHAGRANTCFVSQAALAKELGITARTAHNRIQRLRAKGLIKSKPRWTRDSVRGGRTTDLQGFVWHRKYEEFLRQQGLKPSSLRVGDTFDPYAVFALERWDALRIPFELLNVVSPADALVYGAIASKVGNPWRANDRRGFPSRRWLAQELRKSPRQITASLSVLTRIGAIPPAGMEQVRSIAAVKELAAESTSDTLKKPREILGRFCARHGQPLMDCDWQLIRIRLRQCRLSQKWLLEVARPHFSLRHVGNPVELLKRLASPLGSRPLGGVLIIPNRARAGTAG